MTLIEICIHLIRGVSAHSLSALVFFFFFFFFFFFGGGGEGLFALPSSVVILFCHLLIPEVSSF